MAIKIEMLRCFDAVARSGSLQVAATELGRTASAVSMMLKQFEDHIGAPLFETARKSHLTPLGEQIQTEAHRGLDQFDRSVDTIARLATADEGMVRLAATPSAARSILPAIIRRFVQAHPRVRIDLRDMDSTSVQHALEQGQTDIGIATIPALAGHERRHLLSDPFGVVCRDDHPLASLKRPLRWSDLDGHAFIANGLCSSIQDARFVSILAQSLLNVPNTASIFGLIRAGLGITILPRLAVSEDQSDLRFLPISDCTARRELYVVARTRRQQSPAVRALLEAIDAERSHGQFQNS